MKARIVALTAALAVACRKAGLARPNSLRSWGVAPEASSVSRETPTVREMNCPAHLWLANADARPCHVGPKPVKAMNGEPIALSVLVKDIPDTFTIQDAEADDYDGERLAERMQPPSIPAAVAKAQRQEQSRRMAAVRKAISHPKTLRDAAMRWLSRHTAPRRAAAMEALRAGDLAGLRRAFGRLPRREVRDVMFDLGRALRLTEEHAESLTITDHSPEARAEWLYRNGWSPLAFLASTIKVGNERRPRFPRSTTLIGPTSPYRDARMVSRIVWAAAEPADVATYDALIALWAANPVQNKRTEPTASPYHTHEADTDSEPMDFGPLPEPQEEDSFGVNAEGDAHLTELASQGKRSREANAALLDRLHTKYTQLWAASPRYDIRALVGWYQVGFGAIVTAHYNGLTHRTAMTHRYVRASIANLDNEARAAYLASMSPRYILKTADWKRTSHRALTGLAMARAAGYRLSHPAAAQWSRTFAQWALTAGLLDGESCPVADILRRQAAAKVRKPNKAVSLAGLALLSGKGYR